MKKTLLGLAFIGSVSVTTTALAEQNQTGWMVGGGLGTAKLSINPINQPDLASTNDDATLLTMLGGYNFTPWFGLEFDVSASQDITDSNTQRDANVVGTSISPTFTYHFDDRFSAFLKGGLQYIAYEQDVYLRYDREIVWNDIDVFLGVGAQYTFDFGMSIRLDYKYCDLTLERSENNEFGFDFYDEEIDFTYRTLSLSAFYQF